MRIRTPLALLYRMQSSAHSNVEGPSRSSDKLCIRPPRWPMITITFPHCATFPTSLSKKKMNTSSGRRVKTRCVRKIFKQQNMLFYNSVVVHNRLGKRLDDMGSDDEVQARRVECMFR